MGADSNMRSPTGAGTTTRFVLIAAFVFFFSLVTVLFLWDRGLAGVSFSSDLVQPYLVVGDFLSDASAFYTWQHSPSPYIFPDMFIAAGLVLLPISPKWMSILYSTTLFAGYTMAGGWLVSRTTMTGRRDALLIFALCLLAVLLAANALGGQLTDGLSLTLLAPFIHTGAVLSTLIAMLLLEKIMRAPGSLWANFLLILLVIISTFSDALFAAWFVLPAMIVLWLQAMANRIRTPWLLMAALFTSAGTAIAIERTFHGIKAGKPLRSELMFQAAETLWESVKSTIASPDWIFVILLAFTAGILLSGVKSLHRSLQRSEMPFPAVLDVLLAFSVILGLLAPILTSYFQEQAHWRYLLFFPLFAVLKMALTLSRLSIAQHTGNWIPAFIAAAAMALMAPFAYSTAMAPDMHSEHERCLTSRGLSTGFGDYWVAKRLMYLSARRIHVVQIKADGKRDTYNYNGGWFTHRADDKSPFLANFIIMSGLDPEHIKERFGEARETMQCGGSEIWLYDRLEVP